RREDAREIHRGVSAPHRQGARVMISDRLDKLVEEMVDRGVHFEDAVHEFEKRFISKVLGCCDGSLTRTAGTLGIHRNTLTRKRGEYKLKRHASCPASGSPLLTVPAARTYIWQSGCTTASRQ